MLITIGGYSGTGKTTLGYALQALIKQPSFLLCPDKTRLKVLGLPSGSAITNQHITPEINQRVIQEMHLTAIEQLSHGLVVIVPSAFLNPEMRYQFENTAKELHLPFIGFWLEAPDEILIQRITQRLLEQSNCHVTPDILEIQKQFTVPDDWIKIDVTETVDFLADHVFALLQNNIRNHSLTPS